MTIEAALTRELGIRFIDARCLATEARLREGIDGYPTEQQKSRLLKTAFEIFDEKSEDERFAMKQLNDDLESVKSSHSHSVKRGGNDMDGSDHSGSTIASQNSRGSESGLIKKVCSLGALRGKRRGAADKAAGEKNAAFGLSGSSSQGDMKATSMFGKSRAKKDVHIEGMPPQTRSSRVNRLGNILDIKVPSN
mmetsp:Transcript_104213/g.156054  ORF Transcript_104213/g.156054 Transcript_104213/m.156054 type:complete len:193 (+) Transcript_104213:78-656(+)|eukprot:CAMPEP_0117045604 /NCGR_PEP_ID=MMETSP0472-20121206/31551_1 /TAXON_ID=693140 ORGANISM="Tiarina fusus, Strain LIS" /NCGR_SAMPLE_ID=MMETSP0472 /ASSEMBLY_ACC=CAM_ASM_000603 /LENGTH=192 /DNA_ID=CAMNT_0004757673 /DNA_START=76 /DNA_END=654 /DNA_ORIENTATION=-